MVTGKIKSGVLREFRQKKIVKHINTVPLRVRSKQWSQTVHSR